MNRRPRPFVRYVAIALIVLLLPFVALGTAIAATGTVTVKVHETDGVNLFIPLPALLFDAAVVLAPLVMPDAALADVRKEIAPYRDSLEALAEEIESMPSGVLVDVRSRGDHVRVVKTWRSFRVDVDTEDADIRVSVPARLLSRALDVL